MVVDGIFVFMSLYEQFQRHLEEVMVNVRVGYLNMMSFVVKKGAHMIIAQK